MNIVDSSGWLEYFADGPNAGFFAAPIEATDELVVPSINIYEVFKRILQQRNETAALEAITFMKSGIQVDLTEATALHAARISIDCKLPMADSIMLTTAREWDAVLWTQDADFQGLEGVKYCRKS